MKQFLSFVSFFLFGYHIFGQDSSIAHPSPVLFGPDIISSGEFEFNASFSSDEKTVFFTKATTNWDIIALFRSKKNNGKWTEPELLPFSGQYRDADPFVSHDGKRLYFISDRPVNGSDYKNFAYHIFYVNLDGANIISEPVLLNLPLPDKMVPLYPSVAANGNLYFTANKNGNNDIYVCIWNDGKYQPPALLSFNNEQYHDLDPIVAFDESFLVFTSNSRQGVGNNDLYISFRKKEEWSEPKNLGKNINTRGSDMAPGLSRDNKTLYFTSYREQVDRQQFDPKKMSYKKLVELMHSYKNGLANIYQVGLTSYLKEN